MAKKGGKKSCFFDLKKTMMDIENLFLYDLRKYKNTPFFIYKLLIEGFLKKKVGGRTFSQNCENSFVNYNGNTPKNTKNHDFLNFSKVVLSINILDPILLRIVTNIKREFQSQKKHIRIF